MREPTKCFGENKGADQLCSNSAFVFATQIVQYLLYFNSKFQASSPASVTVQAGLFRTWLETQIIDFFMHRLTNDIIYGIFLGATYNKQRGVANITTEW